MTAEVTKRTERPHEAMDSLPTATSRSFGPELAVRADRIRTVALRAEADLQPPSLHRAQHQHRDRAAVLLARLAREQHHGVLGLGPVELGLQPRQADLLPVGLDLAVLRNEDRQVLLVRGIRRAAAAGQARGDARQDDRTRQRTQTKRTIAIPSANAAPPYQVARLVVARPEARRCLPQSSITRPAASGPSTRLAPGNRRARATRSGASHTQAPPMAAPNA